MEEQPPKPIATILVGASGAGKSSWVFKNRDTIRGPLIDVDAIKNHLGDPASSLHWDLAAAARDRMISILVRRRESFAYETTYAYKEGVKRFKRIIKKGFISSGKRFIGKAIYFDTGDVDANIDRVKVRTEYGGHPVSEEDIRLHYTESVKNILANIRDFQEIDFIDTSGENALNVAHWTPQKGIELFDINQEIKWLRKFSALKNAI